MNPFYDFIPKLIETIEIQKPKKIVEFGVGLSTVLMSKLYPHVEIISLEPNWFWYLINHVVLMLRGCHNVDLYLRRNLINRIPSADLYFLDSPICYKERKKLLSKLQGNILIHDGQEIGYKRRTVLIKKR